MKKYFCHPIFSNTASQILARLFSSGSSFIVTLLITYYLGFETFGSFTKITTFVTFFYIFIDFGLNPIFLQKHFHNAEQLLDRLLTVRFVISIILLFIIVLLSIALPYNPITNSGFSQLEKLGIFLYSLTLFTHSVMLSIQSIFQKKLAYKNGILPSLFSAVVLIVGVLVGVIFNNLYAILLSYFIAGIAYTLTAMYITKVVHFHFYENDLLLFTKDLVKAASPLALLLIFNVVYFRIDTLLLSVMKSTTEVGIYGFSYKFFEFAIIVPTYISNVLYPMLLSINNIQELKIQTNMYVKRMLILGSFATFVGFVSSPLLGFIKDSYTPSITPLQILSLSFPFFFATSILQWFFIIRKRMKYVVCVYALTMLINIVLNFIFIPQFSYIASSYITVLTEGIIFIFLMIQLQFDNAKNT